MCISCEVLGLLRHGLAFVRRAGSAGTRNVSSPREEEPPLGGGDPKFARRPGTRSNVATDLLQIFG